MNMIKAATMELFGTFLLVFVPLAVAIQGQSLGVVATCFGLALSLLAVAIGPLTGGHFNSSVTLAAILSRQTKWTALLPYWVAQVVGAIFASYANLFIWGMNEAKLGAATPHPKVETLWWLIFGVEAFGALVLNFTILASTIDKANRMLSALFIGISLGLMVLVFGSVTGGSFNPARFLGPALVANQWQLWGSYLAGPLVGAVAAQLLYRWTKDTSPPSP